MADLGQLEHTDLDADCQSEPSAELSLKSNDGNARVTSNKAASEINTPTDTDDPGNHAGTNGVANSPVSAEISSRSVNGTNSGFSKANDASVTTKKVTIKEPNDEAGNALNAAEPEDGVEESNTPMEIGMGAGKKKKKKKPKSKRGLVLSRFINQKSSADPMVQQ